MLQQRLNLSNTIRQLKRKPNCFRTKTGLIIDSLLTSQWKRKNFLGIGRRR